MVFIGIVVDVCVGRSIPDAIWEMVFPHDFGMLVFPSMEGA